MKGGGKGKRRKKLYHEGRTTDGEVRDGRVFEHDGLRKRFLYCESC